MNSPETQPDDRPRLLVFSDDWGRHPSSCQHLIGHLLPDYPVCWVDTIGMRSPKLDRATWKRALEKARHWIHPRGSRDLPDNLEVIHPRMWPWFRRPRDRRINETLLLRQLTPVVRRGSRPTVAITTLPLVADLVGKLPVERWIYYCVDDFSQWPGLEHAALDAMEQRLVRRADTLIAVSKTLQERLARFGRASELLTHGVNLDFWRHPAETLVSSPDMLDRIERPLVLYWGLIDRRMDTRFVHCLAERMTSGTIVLVGPENDADPDLFADQRVVRLGRVPFEQLPRLAEAAQVLIAPYADLAVNQAIQPLKLKEYLATGKPVVVRDVRAAREWSDAMDVVKTPDAFARDVITRLDGRLPESQSLARRRLANESWTAKATQFERIARLHEACEVADGK